MGTVTYTPITETIHTNIKVQCDKCYLQCVVHRDRDRGGEVSSLGWETRWRKTSKAGLIKEYFKM